MDIQKALGDITDIKKILDITRRDFSQAARLFLLAGAFRLAKGIFDFINAFGLWGLFSEGTPVGVQVSVLAYLGQAVGYVGFVAVLWAYLACRNAQKNRGAGLGLVCIDIWGCLLVGAPVFSGLITRVGNLLFSMNPQSYTFISYTAGFYIIAMPLLLMATGLLLQKGFPKLLALLYCLVSFVLLFVPNFEYAIANGVTTTVSLSLQLGQHIWPALFMLALGLWLKRTGKHV